jgi:hypothetical protein
MRTRVRHTQQGNRIWVNQHKVQVLLMWLKHSRMMTSMSIYILTSRSTYFVYLFNLPKSQIIQPLNRSNITAVISFDKFLQFIHVIVGSLYFTGCGCSLTSIRLYIWPQV